MLVTLAPQRWHSKPLFWLVLAATAAVIAWSIHQEITFVPGVFLGGHLKIFVVLFVISFVGLVLLWFLFAALWHRLHSR